MSITETPDWLMEEGSGSPKTPLVAQDPNNFGTYQDERRKTISDHDSGSSGSKCCGNDGLLCYFRLVSVMVMVCAVLTAGANIYHIYQQDTNVRDYILRTYGCVFAVVILMLELNVKFIVKGFAILDNWVIRGAFYGFVGLITLDDTNSNYSELQDIVAFVIMGFGGLYCVMGLACLRAFKESREKFLERQRNNA